MRTSKLQIFTSFVFGALVACVSDSGDPSMYLTGTEEQAVTGPNGELTCDDTHKVLICHIPPGNPDNAHTICVDKHAQKAHETHHGDAVGACAGDGGGGDGGDDGGDDGGGGGDTDPPPDDGGGTTPPPDGGGTTTPPPDGGGTTTPPGVTTPPATSVPTTGLPEAHPLDTGGSSGPVL
jgi:hypothetical protein